MGPMLLTDADGRGYSFIMRILLALLLLSPSSAFAQARVTARISLPSAPTAMPVSALAPPALSLSAAVAPSFAPSPVLAAAPVITARAALVQTGSALSAAASEGRDQGAVSRRAFDAGAKTPAEAPAVSAAPSASRPPALEEPNSPSHRIVARTMGPIKTAAAETAEVAVMSVPVAFAALIMKGVMTDPSLLIPSMLALWAAGAWAMRGHLGGLRSTVTDGWQASHDQKYRVDPNTGRLRDIRGHKYGADRYDKWTPGPVGPLATGLIAAGAAVAAAAFLLL